MTHSKKYTFQYGRRTFFVFLRHSHRKTIGICVDSDKKVYVTAPLGSDFAYIESVIQRKSRWICKQLQEKERYQFMEPVRIYTSGQTIRILGREYRLKTIEVPDFEEEQIIKEKGFITAYVYDKCNKERISFLVEDWYRNEALVYLAQKFEECYNKVKKYGLLKKPLYYLRSMRQRWASCTPKGVILFNPEVFQLPSHCIEYVIMHELCHLKYKNHSREFYYFLSTVMPEWKECSSSMDSFLQA